MSTETKTPAWVTATARFFALWFLIAVPILVIGFAADAIWTPDEIRAGFNFIIPDWFTQAFRK